MDEQEHTAVRAIEHSLIWGTLALLFINRTHIKELVQHPSGEPLSIRHPSTYLGRAQKASEPRKPWYIRHYGSLIVVATMIIYILYVIVTG